MRIGEWWWGRRSGDVFGAQELEANGVLRLPSGPGVTVRVEEGQVVVTRAGDPEDHVLEAGTSMDLAGYGRAMAWALRPSRLEVRRLPAREELGAEVALAR